MDELIPSVPRTAAELTGEEGPGLYSALIGAGMGAGMGLIGGGGPVGAVVGGIVGGMGGMGWLDFLGRPTRTLLHTGDTGQAWESIWDSSKAATEQDLLSDIGYQPMDQGEGFDFGDVADFVARAGVGMATDPLSYVNPGALTAKGALRKTAGYNTLGKYFKAQNELRASAKTLGLSPRELEESLGTAANRIANEHNAEMLASEAKHGLESGALGRLESPYVREYTGVSSEPFDVAMGPKASQWKQVKTIEQQLGNFGLGETLAERVKRGEQWTLGFGLPWGHEKSVGIQMDKVVDYLSDKGSTLEQAIGATGTGRWVTDKIRTAREYIFNPIRENAFEELKRQSQNIPWKMLKGIEADHSKLFEDIQSKKLNSDEYAALTELASWDRLAKAGNEYAATKAADARKAFTSPERAAWAAGAADKLRDLETRILDAMQQGGVDVQDMRYEILNRHKAFQSKAERLQEEYLLTKGEYASAKMKMDQAADTAHRAVWDEGVRYSDEVNTYKAEVQRTEIEGEAKKRFEDTVKRYARETKGSKEEIEKRSAEVSLGIRKMAKAWQEKTGGNLTDFYKDHMPTDSETLTEWAKLGRAKETPGASVSATTTTEVVAHPSPGAPGTTTPQTFEDVLRLRESAIEKEVDAYKKHIGLDDAQARKLQKLIQDDRSTSKFERSLTPDQKTKLEDFFEGPLNRKDNPDSPLQWDYDSTYNPTELEPFFKNGLPDEDKAYLTRSLAAVLSDDIPIKQSSDKYIWTYSVAKLLKENGATWMDVAKGVDKYTTATSGSASSKAEYAQLIAERMKKFFDEHGVELPKGNEKGIPPEVAKELPTSATAKEVPPAASSDFQSRLSAVKTTEDTSESIKWAIGALKKAKDASEAEVIVKGVPKDERPELARLLGLDPKKILTPQVKAEFTRAPKSSGASVGRGAGGADEQVAKISEQSAKEFIENKPVVKVPEPVNDTEVAHSLFRTLPAAEKESIISRISNKQVETTDQWLARKPAVDANYEASMREWQNKAPYKQKGETTEEFSARLAEWEAQKPGSAEYNQWLKEKPQEGVVPINRDGYDVYHSYLQDPKRMEEAKMAAGMDPEAAEVLKRQASDYVRVKNELPQDAEMRAILDRLKNSDDAAPAPSVAPVTMKKPERRVYDKIEGVGKVKQPWQMTAQEWSDYVQNAPDKSGELIPISRIVDEHVSSIKNAINRGEVVSPKVLESYQEVADFAAPRVEYIGEKGTAQAYKTAEGGKYWTRNQENLQRVPYEKSMSAKAVAEYMDLQAKVLQKTQVLGEKARALEIAERSLKQFKEMLDKTPEHLHAMLTPEALDSLVKNKTFQRALAGGDKGLLRKFTMVGRPLSLVEMNQLVKEQDRAGQLLALGGALPKGKLSFQDLLAAMHPDDATYTQWAKHSLPVGASDAQIAKKATELKALPPQQRIRAVSEAYGKLFDERPEVAMAASIENASKLISNAQFNDGLKNLFTRRAPTIKLPEAELKETLEHNKQITAEIKSSNDQLSQIGRDMKAAKKDLKSKDPNVASAASEKLNALKEERKQVREELKLLEDQKQPTHKVGLSAQEPSGERWVSAEGLGPQFKGREMKEGVYNQAVRYLEMKNSPMAFQGLMELMRTPTRWYKQMQLSWPGAWFRDTMGNKMLRLQNQGFHSQTLMDSPKLIKVLTSNGDENALKDITFTFDNWQGSKTRKTITGKEMWDFATENGIHGVNQYAIEIGKQVRGKGGVVSKVWDKVMGTPNQFLQDMDRLEMFHARLSHGDAVGEAAARTNLALYDYRSVSPFVDMMRTSGIMPFATWTAKNIPAQFELFIKHPGQFAAMMHAKAAVEQGVPGVSDKDLPAYVDKKFNIILGKDKDGKVWFRTLSGVVPMADLPTLGKMSVGDFLQDALGPLPKMAIEEITNRDSYSGRMIQKYDGQLSPLSDHVPVLKDVLVPVRAKRRLQVAIGRPLSVAEEFMSWSSGDAEGSLQRPKSFMQRNALVGALIGVGPVETDPRMNALQRQKDKQAEVNRALSDAAYYRKRGQFDAAEAAQKRAAELQRQR